MERLEMRRSQLPKHTKKHKAKTVSCDGAKALLQGLFLLGILKVKQDCTRLYILNWLINAAYCSLL